jgi:hypothetical protein
MSRFTAILAKILSLLWTLKTFVARFSTTKADSVKWLWRTSRRGHTNRTNRLLLECKYVLSTQLLVALRIRIRIQWKRVLEVDHVHGFGLG